MIRILVGEREKSGLFPYRITGGPYDPMVGLAFDGLMEALRILQHLGVRLGTPIEYTNPSTGEYAVIRLQDHLHLPKGVPKALPAPRRRPRKRPLQVRGSGVPGDG